MGCGAAVSENKKNINSWMNTENVLCLYGNKLFGINGILHAHRISVAIELVQLYSGMFR